MAYSRDTQNNVSITYGSSVNVATGTNSLLVVGATGSKTLMPYQIVTLPNFNSVPALTSWLIANDVKVVYGEVNPIPLGEGIIKDKTITYVTPPTWATKINNTINGYVKGADNIQNAIASFVFADDGSFVITCALDIEADIDTIYLTGSKSSIDRYNSDSLAVQLILSLSDWLNYSSNPNTTANQVFNVVSINIFPIKLTDTEFTNEMATGITGYDFNVINSPFPITTSDDISGKNGNFVSLIQSTWVDNSTNNHIYGTLGVFAGDLAKNATIPEDLATVRYFAVGNNAYISENELYYDNKAYISTTLAWASASLGIPYAGFAMLPFINMRKCSKISDGYIKTQDNGSVEAKGWIPFYLANGIMICDTPTCTIITNTNGTDVIYWDIPSVLVARYTRSTVYSISQPYLNCKINVSQVNQITSGLRAFFLSYSDNNPSNTNAIYTNVVSNFKNITVTAINGGNGLQFNIPMGMIKNLYQLNTNIEFDDYIFTYTN